MKTTFATLIDLANYCINLLKEKGFIEFDITNREPLLESMATELAVSFATDEDIRDQAIEDVEETMGKNNLPEDVTESEIFNHSRKEIIKSFSGENVAGLYLVESLHFSAERINKFLLQSDLIEEVFATDEELTKFLIAKIRRFRRS